MKNSQADPAPVEKASIPLNAQGGRTRGHTVLPHPCPLSPMATILSTAPTLAGPQALEHVSLSKTGTHLWTFAQRYPTLWCLRLKSTF